MADRRIFGLPRTVVLVAGAVYLAAAIALWSFYVITGARLPYDDTIDQGDSDLSMFHDPAVPPPRYARTAIEKGAVGAVVVEEAGVNSPGPALCTAASAGIGIGLWTCTYAAADGRILPARIEIDRSGDYMGVFTDPRGIERGFAGCCLRRG